MRILVAGDWHSELHEAPVYEAFRSLGHQVARFAWHGYFGTSHRQGARSSLLRRVQNRYLVGPLLHRVNREFLAALDEHAPDLVFVYRGTHITAKALAEAKRRHPRAVLVGYNNDDPYAPGRSWWMWRHFLAAIPRYDLMLAYRHHNVEEFRRAGGRRVELLRSWYIPERNHPVTLSAQDLEKFGCDVVFVGHYEADGRKELLETVARQGWRLRLFGPGYDWDPAIASSPELNTLRPVQLVWGEDYNRALCGAKIALCFLSRLNRDTYTRRCFEIPATGTLMLSEYTEDQASMFRPGLEADYFRGADELLAKIRLYLGDEALRQRVAEAGMRRVAADGHDVVSRMRQVLAWAAEAEPAAETARA